MKKKRHINRSVIISVVLMMIVCITLPFSTPVRADDSKVVRVGWHEPPYFITDQYGRKSGYSYEYQLKVAAYTGWRYEYVEGTWSDLFEMLKKGEIDLLSDISYTEERAEEMIFSSIPMGTESYYVFISPDNTEIVEADYSTLNGKSVGIPEGTIQVEFFKEWAAEHNVEAQIIEINCDSEEGIKKIGTEFDAFVTMDTFGSHDTAVPLWKVGSSDFYFVVSKDRPDLAAELDEALNRIQDENKYYDQQLHDKYLKSTETYKYLSNPEIEWLEGHGKIRVGYQDDYLSFCAKDPKTGELTGALKEYLEYASSVFENADVEFETIAYPTASDALEALKRGEIDCVFPANLTNYDAEQMDIVMSPPLMRSRMDAVVRESEQADFLNKEEVVVAVNNNNPNYDLFLEENFPGWSRAYFKDTSAGLYAVSAGTADCVIVSSYRYGNIAKQCETLHLTTVYTTVDMDYCFAVRLGDTELYSILSRVTGVVPDEVINSALNYYSAEAMKTTFGDLIRDNLGIIMTVVAVVLLVILILLWRSLRAERKMHEEERLVKDLNAIAFVDSLTSVRNKASFMDYMQKLQERLDRGDKISFAVGVFDCNDLKKINDECGHDKGDTYLKNACDLICRVFEHSPVFRMGGDEFAVFLQNCDFKNREALIRRFADEQDSINESASDIWKEVHVAFGIAVYEPGVDDSIEDAMRRADKIMYENKRLMKEKAEA